MIEPLLLGAAAIGAMLVLLTLGVPVGIAMIAVGFVGIGLEAGWTTALTQIQTLPYSFTASYTFAVMPLFILMGAFAVNAGVVDEVYDLVYKWLGHFRGALYLATIGGQAGFAGLSGSTVVDATVFTRTVLPQMLRLGYPKAYAGACIAATGSFAAMIPPSVTMVIYGILTEVSIGKMLIAGILPGILAMLVYMAAVLVGVRLWPAIAPPPEPKVAWGVRLRALRGLWVIALIFALVMGGIYSGIFPVSGAAAAGAFGMLVVGVARRRLTWDRCWDAARASAALTAVMFTIIIGGLLFSRLLLLVGFVDVVGPLILSVTDSPLTILIALAVLYIVLGAFIDSTSMMVVTLPFVFPIIAKAGIDPIWFGIILVKLVEIAVITPPVGMNLFAVAAAGRGQLVLEDLIRGIWPFVVLELIILALLIAFPPITLLLPMTMFAS